MEVSCISYVSGETSKPLIQSLSIKVFPGFPGALMVMQAVARLSI